MVFKKSHTKWMGQPLKLMPNYTLMMLLLGCPFKMDLNVSQRPFVDWESVEKILIHNKIIKMIEHNYCS